MYTDYLNFSIANEYASIAIDRHFSYNSGTTGFDSQEFNAYTVIAIYFSYDKTNWYKYRWFNGEKVGYRIPLDANHPKVYLKGNLNKGNCNLITFVMQGGEVYADGGPNSLYNESPEILEGEYLSPYAFCGMFSGCTNLVQAPKLDYLNIPIGCYMNMFEGCTSLQKAPYLPAKMVPRKGYKNMFKGCTSLNYVNTNMIHFDNDSIYNWLYGVSNEGTISLRNELLNFNFYSNELPPSAWTKEYVTIEDFTLQDIHDTKNEHTFFIRPFSINNRYRPNGGHIFPVDGVVYDGFFYPNPTYNNTFCENDRFFFEAFVPGCYHWKIATSYGGTGLIEYNVDRRRNGCLRNYIYFSATENQLAYGTYFFIFNTEIGEIIDKWPIKWIKYDTI